MKILITGGAGFIGGHTAEHARSLGHEVVVLDDLSTGHRSNLPDDVPLIEASVADRGAVREAVAGCTHVLHLAACPSVPGSCEDPIGYDLVNVHGAVIVFEEARRAGVQRAAFASSSAVYGADPTLPKTESLPLQAHSPYAAAKAALELYAQSFTHTLGLPVVGLRYFNVVGPRQHPDGPYAAVLPVFVRRALAGAPLTIYGDGEQSRDFVAVQDVVRANLAALQRGDGAYNIGTGRGTSILHLARLVLRATGSHSVIEHGPERAGDVRHSVASIERAAHGLDWRPEADLDATLVDTIAWYRSHA